MFCVQDNLDCTQPSLSLFQTQGNLVIGRTHHGIPLLHLHQIQLVTSQAVQTEIYAPTDALSARDQQKYAQSLPLEPQGAHQGEPRLVSPPLQDPMPGTNIETYRSAQMTEHQPEPLDQGHEPREATQQALQPPQDPRQHFRKRTGVLIKPLKRAQIKVKDGFTLGALEAWRKEKQNPTQPPPSRIPHRFKHLTRQPPLNCSWGPGDFLRSVSENNHQGKLNASYFSTPQYKRGEINLHHQRPPNQT